MTSNFAGSPSGLKSVIEAERSMPCTLSDQIARSQFKQRNSNINSKFYFCMSLISISLSIYMVNLLSIRNRCPWLGHLPLRKAWAVVGLHLPPNTSECIIVAAATVNAMDPNIRTRETASGSASEGGWNENGGSLPRLHPFGGRR